MPNVEALLKVVEILEATPDEAVDLQTWTCETTACAIGHAAQHPWFVERGFLLSKSPCRWPIKKDAEGKILSSMWNAVEEFFGLTDYSFRAESYSKELKPSKERGDVPPCYWLFNVECYLSDETDTLDTDTLAEFYQKQQEIGIRQQVIDRIKGFVDGL